MEEEEEEEYSVALMRVQLRLAEPRFTRFRLASFSIPVLLRLPFHPVSGQGNNRYADIARNARYSRLILKIISFPYRGKDHYVSLQDARSP